MGAGSFPVGARGEIGKKLVQAAELVESVCEDMTDDVYSGDSGGMQYDNAAADGGSLALLRLAVKLIRDEVKI